MNSLRLLAPSLCLVVLVAGCTLQEAKDNPSPAAPQTSPASAASVSEAPTAPTAPTGATTTAVAPPEAETMQAGGPGGAMPQGMPPGMPGMPGMAANPLTKTPELDKKITDAEKDGDKKKIAVAYAERGTFRMNDEAAGARVKYRAALEDYRKALAADPTNTSATTNKKLIEDIYHSMGRPVPGEEETKPAKP